MSARRLGAAGLLSLALAAGAGVPGTAPAAVAEADRMHALAAELRCLVCQNESLADSNAPLALDLKREIAQRIHAGDSDAQIIDFLVERYGDFVTYRPPWRASTLLLWLGPPALLLAAGAWLWRQLRDAGPT
ncbi:MAG: hypothetical protein RL654_1479 [Pseudomonadota bacterium]|jgi:cytochrome c-type biogenesis protein CcmH